MTTPHDDIINRWIAVSNDFDTAGYLGFFTEGASIDDPSIGDVFEGEAGLRRYFENYFIGYKTQTRVVSIEPHETFTHVEVDFTGTFPGGQVGGIFDVTFEGEKIATIRADLI